MIEAFRDAWMDCKIGVVLLTGNGPSPKDGKWTFCADGDQSVRRHAGYVGAEGIAWAQEILKKSPIAIRFLKAGLNAELDGQTGLQVLAGDATMLFYMTEECSEGKNAFLEGREPEFNRYPWRP